MSKEELDVVIKIQLFHHRHDGVNTKKKKHKKKERERPRQKYYFGGKRCEQEKVDAIAHSLEDGLDARSHGNKGKLPKHVLTLNDVKIIKHFLIAYGNKYGLPLPGRLPNYKEHRIILLLSDKSKDVYYDYIHCSCCRRSSPKKEALAKQCPHITIIKPATDLCHKCQMYVSKLKDCGNLSEEENCSQLQEYQQHLENCKIQRDEY
ncbi:hypothetical protein KUTeg_015022 [Tegillarca granosa]|uniref:Uncharacterized protein n=1 Tax=Tegillarca granosa TaxID=220873 RepID=A0ABQ9ENX1_TEGGR|nr:hypothetical protein KUTeg_015022 [Tegillarca granosa]